MGWRAIALTVPSFLYLSFSRGMKFEYVAVLVESIGDVLKDMRYCWYVSHLE